MLTISNEHICLIFSDKQHHGEHPYQISLCLDNSLSARHIPQSSGIYIYLTLPTCPDIFFKLWDNAWWVLL